MRIKMGFSRMSQWMVLALMLIYLVTGCGDLEPEMQDTRTVILNMDFYGKSSSRSSSSVSANELSQYNTRLILALPSGDVLTSNYKNFYNSFAQGLMNTADKKVSLEIPLNTQMIIFAFLFQEYYSMSEFFSGTREVGYYGESQSFSIDTQTNNLSLGITLIQVSGTDTGGDSDNGGGTDIGGGTDTGGDTDTGGGSTDTTPPVIEEFSGITTPTTDTTPDYTFSSSEAGIITYGGSCATTGSATTAIVGHNLITYNTLSDGSYINCTITVTDLAGNVSNTLPVTPFTVNTTVTNDTIDTTLLAHYAFEGNLFDNSSYNRDLTEDNVSNITYSATDNQSDKYGRAALFNGDNTSASANITVGDNFTIAFWTNPDSPNMDEYASVMSTAIGDTSGGRFQIDYSGAGKLRFNVSGGVISDNLSTNEWNHFVITRSDNGSGDNKVCLYKNGGPSSTCDVDFITQWDLLKVGENRNGGKYWKGYIDELKIYSRTFSAQEVVDHFGNESY